MWFYESVKNIILKAVKRKQTLTLEFDHKNVI